LWLLCGSDGRLPAACMRPPDPGCCEHLDAGGIVGLVCVFRCWPFVAGCFGPQTMCFHTYSCKHAYRPYVRAQHTRHAHTHTHKHKTHPNTAITHTRAHTHRPELAHTAFTHTHTHTRTLPGFSPLTPPLPFPDSHSVNHNGECPPSRCSAHPPDLSPMCVVGVCYSPSPATGGVPL